MLAAGDASRYAMATGVNLTVRRRQHDRKRGFDRGTKRQPGNSRAYLQTPKNPLERGRSSTKSHF